MDSILDSVTSALVNKSLDLAMLQQQVIANNIANVDTRGYTPLKVNFAEQWSRMEQILQSGEKPQVIERLKQLDVNAAVEVQELAARVSIDSEMTALAKNTVNYQALLKARGNLGAIMSMAISGERR